MTKYCINCQKEKVIELNVNNKKVYYCPLCHTESERFLVKESEIATIMGQEGKTHITVGAIIQDGEKILFLDRRGFPYGLDFPAGHLEFGEKPEEAIRREVREETGLTITSAKLVLETTLKNKCRYGVNQHLWLLYECTVDNFQAFANSESKDIFWLTKKQALKTNLVESCRKLLKLPKSTEDLKPSLVFPLAKETNNPISIYEEQRERQQELLFHISRSLFKLDSIDNVLRVAVTEAIKALDSFSVSIFLLDSSGEKLISKAYIRHDNKSVPTNFSQFDIGEGVAGLCALNRQPLIITDVSKSTIYTGKADDHGGIACIPMFANGKLIGVLSVSYAEPKKFSESEIHFLSILSSMAAIALENSILLDKQRGRTDNLAQLFGVTFSQDKKISDRIQEIINTIPPLFEANLCHFWMINRKKNQLESVATSERSPKILKHIKPIPLKRDCITSRVFTSGKPIIINNAANERLIALRYRNLFSIKSQLSAPVFVGNSPIGVLHIVNQKDNNFTEDDLKLAMIVGTRLGTKIENIKLLSKAKVEGQTLKNVIENINEGIIAISLHSHKVRIWNRYCEELFNIASDKIVGKDINILKKIGFNHTLAELKHIADTGEIEDRYHEETLTTASQGEVNLSVSLTLAAEPKQDSTVILVVRNVSKEKALMRAKNDLISTATHELRTPLTATKGYLSMLINGDAGPIDGKVKKYSEKALSSTNRLVNLVEDLLSALRIEERKINLNLQNFDINNVIEDAVESFKNKSTEKNIAIYFKRTKEVFAYADPLKTRQVIDNLIDNAIKYTQEKGAIKIMLENRERDVLIKVSDNGIGIPENSLGNVFDRFVRIENPLSVKAGGTGLGLYIVKNLVERQGGKIWAKSKIKKGSDFYFTLPNSNFLNNNQ